MARDLGEIVARRAGLKKRRRTAVDYKIPKDCKSETFELPVLGLKVIEIQ